MRRGRRWLAAAGLALAMGLTSPGSARAWDPSTTHMAMVERSMLDSALHLRWMERSLLQRGVFSPLRLDPARLDAATLRDLRLAMRAAHAASGAQARGGPGACPGASAPASTRVHCVYGDLWETTGLGWLQLGVIVETVPTERLLHHFVDREDPTAARWSDDDLPRSVLRSKHADAGGTVASRATGAGFEGSGRSALAWLEDGADRWAPPALAHHLTRASLAPTAAERDHHLALALMCTGALLHVMQDLSVPAHARGDVSAMFLPLSTILGDRGLPLQEMARDAYGRGGLPTPVALAPRPTAEVGRGIVRAPTLRAHVLGHGDFAGLVHEAGRRFFSESSLPPARRLSVDLDATTAAARVLEGVPLDAAEREGARLAPWPADRGYLQGGSGRPLAAYRVDEEGAVTLWLDRRVYRTQMQQLIPLGVDVGRSVLDLVHPAWPSMSVDAAARRVTLTPGELWKDATLQVMLEDGSGARESISSVAMQGPTAHRVVDAWPATIPDDSRVVLVLLHRDGRIPAVVEQTLDLSVATEPSQPKAAVPRPRARPPTTRRSPAGPRRGVVAPGDGKPTDAATPQDPPDDPSSGDAAADAATPPVDADSDAATPSGDASGETPAEPAPVEPVADDGRP